MNKILEKIRESITLEMQKMDIIVDSVKYETEGGYNFLRIELDKVNGIDLDTIVEATNVINPIIDKLDLIDDSYILDVVSKEKGSV
jgi:ribosome maturation factor RimP